MTYPLIIAFAYTACNNEAGTSRIFVVDIPTKAVPLALCFMRFVMSQSVMAGVLRECHKPSVLLLLLKLTCIQLPPAFSQLICTSSSQLCILVMVVGPVSLRRLTSCITSLRAIRGLQAAVVMERHTLQPQHLVLALVATFFHLHGGIVGLAVCLEASNARKWNRN